MRVGLLTREYPPDVYGGAGVHVEYLARELARLADVVVHCWGAARGSLDGWQVTAHEPWSVLDGEAPYVAALQAVSVDLAMAHHLAAADVVHSHTWYTQLGGHIAKLLHGIPHVTTVHSLEPLRPWKEEQLGGGYRLSGFCERTALEGADAVIAVSRAVRDDTLACYPAIDPGRVHVIHNGVDLDDYRPSGSTAVLERFGIDTTVPVVLFVGRISRQKGIHHLLAAAPHLVGKAQIVVRAGSADTPELAAEVARDVEVAAAAGHAVTHITEQLDRQDLADLYGAAAVACCPSIYEPFGLVVVEAMACSTPVVASAVGGILDIVEHGENGLLVPFEPDPASPFGEPTDPGAFARGLAAAIDEVLADDMLADRLHRASRRTVEEQFAWPAIAERTVELYRSLL
jgi:starch synthase